MQTISIALDLPLDNNVLALYFSNRQIPTDTFTWLGTQSVPEGRTFEVQPNGAVNEVPAAVVPVLPNSPTLKELTDAFLAAAGKCKEKGDPKFLDAMKALGCPTVKGVPAVMYVEVIAALNAITNG